MQIFIKLHGGRTRALSFELPHVPVSLLKEKLEDYEGIPVHEQRLVCSQRELADEALLVGDDLFFLSLSLRVAGGKGGFGSLLRGASTRVGQKKTDNFDACRDLSGRRLRHANNEKKIAEWIAQEKERELEKVAQQYIKKLAHEHHFDDQKYSAESKVITESVSVAIEKGIDEAKKTLALRATRKRPNESDESGPLTKKRHTWDELDDIPEYEFEPEVKEKKRRTHSDDDEAEDANTTSTSTSTSTPTTSTSTSSSTSTSTLTFTSTSTSSSTPTTLPFPERDDTTSTTSPASVPSPTPSSPPSSSSPAPSSSSTPSPPPSEPVDLRKYESAEELEKGIGADALKAELQRLGLLCGGTPAERAARLFLLKTIPLDQLDKKHFAKKNNNKRKR